MLASLPEEIEGLEWSPDGTAIAFVGRLRDEAQYAPKRDADRPPRRITHLGWKYDNVGWVVDRPRSFDGVEAGALALGTDAGSCEASSWTSERLGTWTSERLGTWTTERLGASTLECSREAATVDELTVGASKDGMGSTLAAVTVAPGRSDV